LAPESRTAFERAESLFRAIAPGTESVIGTETTLFVVSIPGIVAVSAVSVFFSHADNTHSPTSAPTATFVIVLPSNYNYDYDLNTVRFGQATYRIVTAP
jgi:hypothetical protein